MQPRCTQVHSKGHSTFTRGSSKLTEASAAHRTTQLHRPVNPAGSCGQPCCIDRRYMPSFFHVPHASLKNRRHSTYGPASEEKVTYIMFFWTKIYRIYRIWHLYYCLSNSNDSVDFQKIYRKFGEFWPKTEKKVAKT